MKAINLAEKLASFNEPWTPKIIGELNGQYVKLAKLEGEFVWHQHEHEDEMFLVINGHVDLHFSDKIVALDEGEICIVPRGVEHKPVAKRPASIMLFEPVSTRNTGNAEGGYTVEAAELEEI